MQEPSVPLLEITIETFSKYPYRHGSLYAFSYDYTYKNLLVQYTLIEPKFGDLYRCPISMCD